MEGAAKGKAAAAADCRLREVEGAACRIANRVASRRMGGCR